MCVCVFLLCFKLKRKRGEGKGGEVKGGREEMFKARSLGPNNAERLPTLAGPSSGIFSPQGQLPISEIENSTSP